MNKEKRKNYKHLCNHQEAHRLYHAIGYVCSCPQPCESCGTFDVDILHYSPDFLAVRKYNDWTPVWSCEACGEYDDTFDYNREEEDDFIDLFD